MALNIAYVVLMCRSASTHSLTLSRHTAVNTLNTLRDRIHQLCIHTCAQRARGVTKDKLSLISTRTSASATPTI